jgi:DNA-3-methyladenine glycosylase II
MWRRSATFGTLVRIILEQQVSLASADAAYRRLSSAVGRRLNPESLLRLSDEEFRRSSVSRQKTRYLRELSRAVQSKSLDLSALEAMPDDDVRASMTSVVGIGQWTSNVYLMLALGRTDVFPLGDIALMNSVKHEFELVNLPDATLLDEMSNAWSPYRTIAAFMLWHAYIQRKGIAMTL